MRTRGRPLGRNALDGVAGQYGFVAAEGDVDEVGEVAPFEAGLDLAGLQAGHVKQISDEAVESGGAFLDFAGEGLLQGGLLAGLEGGQRAGGGGDGGNGGAQLVRNGVKQRLAQFLGFRQQARLFGLGVQPETVQHQRRLPGKGVEQVALFEGGRLAAREV